MRAPEGARSAQNLGLFEAYVARHASSGDDVDAPQALEVLATAAGPRMWNTILTRLSDESAERARHLLASVDVQERPDA